MKSLLFATTLVSLITSETHIIPAQVTEVYDGDTIKVIAEIWPGLEWKGSVRLDGVDTPELGHRAKCASEAARAFAVRDYIAHTVGDQVLIVNPKHGKYAGRVVAEVLTVDGMSLSQLLIANDMAREYHGGKRKGWCREEEIPQ